MSKDSASIPLSPVAGWSVSTIPTYTAVMLRLDFLLHATQRPEEAQHTPNLLLNAQQALELSELLRKAAESALQGIPGDGLAKH